ncbi:MAG: dNTP triphosphohydrolase [candidate division KSB1 bacterium]|jgi:dGTPase|nr:dNTP triphosphohydrolase [candidate division KSB1 bacterium]
MNVDLYAYRKRGELEEIESATLSDYAKPSRGAHRTRTYPEPEHGYRTAFQRDRDRIIHSRAFRRLKHKQQVFLISDGDHYRTRLTHTLEVAQLSRTMARALGLNEDLVEAIALGHDLGHTPYGHAGEVVLNAVLCGKDDLDGAVGHFHRGGFKHNYQSLRIVDRIEKKYADFDGLNLTAYVREGILKHTGLKRGVISYPDFLMDGLHYELDAATTLEGQLVAMCDEIAQRTHDLEDGIRAGHVQLKQVRELEIVRYVDTKLDIQALYNTNSYAYRNAMIKGLIEFLVMDIIESSLKRINKYKHIKNNFKKIDQLIIDFSDSLNPLQENLDLFIRRQIIDTNQTADKVKLTQNRIRDLFKLYLRHSDALPDFIAAKLPSISSNSGAGDDGSYLRIIVDHIAGMTDRYVESELSRLRKIYEH